MKVHKGSPEELIKKYMSPEHYRPRPEPIAGFVGITSEAYYSQRAAELEAVYSRAERRRALPLYLMLIVCGLAVGAVLCVVVTRW